MVEEAQSPEEEGEELDSQDLEFRSLLIQQIEEQTDKARDIVRTLLEFARTKEFNKEKLRLAELFARTLQLLRSERKSEEQWPRRTRKG